MKIQIGGFFSPIYAEATSLELDTKMPHIIGVAFTGRHGLTNGQIESLDVELTNFEFPGIFRLKAANVIDDQTVIADSKNAMWIPRGNL